MNPELERLVRKYPDLTACVADIQRAFTYISTGYRQGGKLLLCGNGGSAADCEHIVGELMKGFMLPRPVEASFQRKLAGKYPDDGPYLAEHLQRALPAISLAGHTALGTALANDVTADMIFAQQVYGYGREGDVLLAISTSGNSPNVLNALKVAGSLGLCTVGLTGKSGGEMYGICDVIIRVPHESTPDVQERHLPIYHALCIMLEKEFFDDDNSRF